MEDQTMSITHHKYLSAERPETRASRASVWLLIIVVVAAFMALTFGDASGAGLL